MYVKTSTSIAFSLNLNQGSKIVINAFFMLNRFNRYRAGTDNEEHI